MRRRFTALMCIISGTVAACSTGPLREEEVGKTSSALSVTTQRGNTARTGEYPDNTLSPSKVAVGQIGRLWRNFVDGAIYAQPLVVEGVSTPQGIKTVVYVVTNNNTLARNQPAADISQQRSHHKEARPHGEEK